MDSAIVLTAELPGLEEDDVEIEIKDRRLILRGQKNIAHDDTGDLRVSERSYGSSSRAMPLPDAVEIDKISATFDKGVLHIEMPKTEPHDPSRKIKVSSKKTVCWRDTVLENAKAEGRSWIGLLRVAD
ncbi:Hsp20/alpha crystallin family protein [uncultured Ruegeria sp.]|uniref:Hsp20/alpha crystallin family protein n=1 Tax=uncultured Ruegeria sp. TaxID=259304 RepID=UPI0026191051|nr:Hsp20/alpha crystallin family protein [uncultured Ruegeria sp.]